MGNTAKILFAYALGQATQLVIHGACLANNMYSYRQIPFCIAAGFLVLFATVSGALIGRNKAEKPAHEKTYKEWAEIPEDNIDEVVNPFSGTFKK